MSSEAKGCAVAAVIVAAVLATVSTFFITQVELVSWWFGWDEQAWWSVYWKAFLLILGVGAILYIKEELPSEEETSERQPPSKKPSGRKPIPRAVKVYVWQRDQGKCVECGSKERLEYDHIIPLSKGGGNTDRNLQLLCERCNRSKGASI